MENQDYFRMFAQESQAAIFADYLRKNTSVASNVKTWTGRDYMTGRMVYFVAWNVSTR